MIIQLHVHTEYSLLDGIITIPKYVQYCVENKLPVACITDHGSTAGFPELFFECKEHGIKPIFGCEFYFYNLCDIKKTYHIVLIAQNNVGLKNLLILATKSYDTENFYKKPRINFELLKQYSTGLICLTACPAGLIFDPKDGEKYLMLLYDIFGKNLYLELSSYNDNKVVLGFSRKYKIPYVITNDVHYLKKEDSTIHEMQLKSNTKGSFSMKDYYLHYDYKYKYSDEQYKRAERNINKIIESCEATVITGKFMPEVKWLKEEEKANYIKTLADKKLKDIGKQNSKKYLRRFNYEFDVIKKSGYLDYFIIVADYVNWARNQGIFVGWGRGSAAGSLLTYLANITQIDPIKHDLIFERFINPERPSVPDIDVDFEDLRRNEVKKYIATKYGKNNTAQIGTWGTRGTKFAFRDVARILDISQKEIGQILACVDSGKQSAIAIYKKRYPELFEYAEKLKGIKRSLGTHAAGMIISSESLTGKIPLSYDSETDTYNSLWDMYALEKMGYAKFDILGLRSMSTLRICEELVKKYYKIELNMTKRGISIYGNDNQELNSLMRKRVYSMLSDGKTTGVFEFEGWSAQQACQSVRIDTFEDIVAINALTRPGASGQMNDYIRAKKRGATYIHPKLEPILKSSRGVLLYDDQVMRIVADLADFDPIKVDEFRKTMKATSAKAVQLYKEKDSAFLKYRKLFIRGCHKNGILRKTAEDIYNYITAFDGYGFNKNHATAYSITTFVTAFMKVTVPEIFTYAYLMTAGDKNISRLLQEVRVVKMTPPNINHSDKNFTLKHDERKILEGLCSVKGIGESMAEKIIENRPYESLEDFLTKMKGKGIKQDIVMNLIDKGVFGKEKVRLKKTAEDFQLKKERPKKKAKFTRTKLF